MLSAVSSFTWEEAPREYFPHLQTSHSKRTQRYYQATLSGIHSRGNLLVDLNIAAIHHRSTGRITVAHSEGEGVYT